MSSENETKEPRHDLKTTAEKMRRDITHAGKDLASASKTWAESTSKFVQTVVRPTSTATPQHAIIWMVPQAR